MNRFALSHRTYVSRSTLGQEHCVSELAMPPVMNLLETLHSHLPEVRELLGTPLLPGTSIFFNCRSSKIFFCHAFALEKGNVVLKCKFPLTTLKLEFLKLVTFVQYQTYDRCFIQSDYLLQYELGSNIRFLCNYNGCLTGPQYW